MRVFPFLAPLVVLLLALPAGAEGCVPTTSNPEINTCAAGVEIGIAGSCDYVDNDFCQFDNCLFSIWWYFEANGIEGLQRGDEVKDDTCGGQIPSDHIVS